MDASVLELTPCPACGRQLCTQLVVLLQPQHEATGLAGLVSMPIVETESWQLPCAVLMEISANMDVAGYTPSEYRIRLIKYVCEVTIVPS